MFKNFKVLFFCINIPYIFLNFISTIWFLCNCKFFLPIKKVSDIQICYNSESTFVIFIQHMFAYFAIFNNYDHISTKYSIDQHN